MENDKKLYVGIDLGVESVGFAATDEHYNVLKAGGKFIRGVRLFEEANTSEKRRIFRSAKVRLARTKRRLNLLQELFESEISKVDPLFFIRLKASSFWQDDKKRCGLSSLNSLFADADFKDKEYFKQFKSIYALRLYLQNPENWKQKQDIRLVYLACHHILKSRGHFLLEADKFSVSEAGISLFEKLNDSLTQRLENEDINLELFNLDNFSQVEQIAQDEKLNLTKRKEALQEVLCKSKNKYLENIIRAFLGAKVKITDIFPEYDLEKDENSYSLSSDWEKTASKISAILGDDFHFVELLKEIYDWFMLAKLLKGTVSLSEAMVAKYDKHRCDLIKLKELVKEKANDKYKKIFTSIKEKSNYAAYIGSNKCRVKTIIKKCTQDEFYEFLKTELGDVLTDDMKTDMENGQFLPKLRRRTMVQFLINCIKWN